MMDASALSTPTSWLTWIQVDDTDGALAKATLRARTGGAAAVEQADTLDQLATDMLAEWQEGMGELIDPVQAALANATSFDDFSRALEAGLGEIEPGKLVDLLARGTFAARIWGLLNQVKRPTAEK